MRAVADAAADQRQELTALSKDLAAAQAGSAIGRALAQDLIDIDASLKSALGSAQSEFNEFFSNLPIDPMEQALKQSAVLVAQALNNTIGTAIEGLITGAEDLNESLQKIASSLLRDIGSALVRIGIGGLGTPGQAGSGSGLLGSSSTAKTVALFPPTVLTSWASASPNSSFPIPLERFTTKTKCATLCRPTPRAAAQRSTASR